MISPHEREAHGLFYLSPRALIAHLNTLDDRQIGLGTLELKHPKRALWLPGTGVKQVEGRGKYVIWREKREEDIGCLERVFGSEDEKLGYLFFERGNVRYGSGDEDVRSYEIIKLRLNEELEGKEGLIPLKVCVRAECDGYATPTVERKDHVRRRGFWMRQPRPIDYLPLAAFETPAGMSLLRIRAA